MPVYHLSFTSHQETLYRSIEDMNVSFNCLCSSLYKTDSQCYAESSIPNHHHGCYVTRHPEELLRNYRQSYTKLFNRKYERQGELGERGYFIQETDGLRHLLTLILYILNNAVHHGLVCSPFEYPYCSVNSYFRKELGKEAREDYLLTVEQIRKRLPRRAAFDPRWKMGVEGVFLRETVIDTATVEHAFATPQAFLYLLGRKSTAERYKEQDKDNNGRPPITLENMESLELHSPMKDKQTLEEMLQNEKRRYASGIMTDLDVCSIIDNEWVPRFGKRSVYHLSDSEKTKIGNELFGKYHIPVVRIRRTLIM